MNFLNVYFFLWALVLPITSILVIPSVQGTTPAYIFALTAIVLIPLLVKNYGIRYIILVLTILLITLFISLVAQFSLSLSNITNFGEMRMVDPRDKSLLLRDTMFTQTLYLLAGISTFSFIRVFYRVKWDNYIFIGIIFLAIFGIYECIYFLIFGQSGDFLSNRTFGEGLEGSGSLFQIIQLGPFAIERLKSLTGEPSMYAFTVLPFWIYAIHTKRFLIQFILFVTLLLSTSTTAILGLLIYFVGYLMYFKLRVKYIISFMITLIILYFGFYQMTNDFLTEMVVKKINMENLSGIDRFESFRSGWDFFVNSPILNKLFGVGFGYIRSTDMFATLLINTGILGVILVTMAFAIPIFKLPNSYRNIGIKLSLITIYLTMMISVSEFAYLSIWLFLGIAYNEIDSIKRFGVV